MPAAAMFPCVPSLKISSLFAKAVENLSLPDFHRHHRRKVTEPNSLALHLLLHALILPDCKTDYHCHSLSLSAPTQTSFELYSSLVLKIFAIAAYYSGLESMQIKFLIRVSFPLRNTFVPSIFAQTQ